MDNLTPRQRRQAKTRDEILTAAMAIISEKGPDNLTLRGLARRVDYSPAGLYEYFDGKEDIINAVCEEGDRRLQSYLRAIKQQKSSPDKLTELGLAYIRFALDNQEHFMLMFSQLDDGPSISYDTADFGETYQILLDAVQEAITDEMIATKPGFDLREIAYSLWALTHGLAMLQVTNLRRLDADFEAIDRLALQSFIRGLR